MSVAMRRTIMTRIWLTSDINVNKGAAL